MADEDVKANAAPKDGDDTITRKTIRLRPMPAAAKPPVPPSAQSGASAPDAAPVAPAVDDAGDDTKTRRTIKLKPIAARPAMSGAAPTPPSPPPVAPVVQKPVAPTPVAPSTPVTPPPPVPVAPPVSVAPANDGADTVTRKTLVLKPMSAGGPTTPAAKPAVPPPAPAASDNTVKLQRPAPKPLTPPPAPKPLTPPQPPKTLTPPPAPKPQAVPPPPAPAPAPAPAPVASTPAFDAATAGKEAPSVLYLILAAVSLICLIYSTLLITVQFLDLTQGQKVEEQIPAVLLPKAK